MTNKGRSMKRKKLGDKHVCFQCGCRFYDLNRPQPLCPKCGVDQTEAKKKGATHSVRHTSADSSFTSPRSRKRKIDDDSWEDPELPLEIDETLKKESFEDDGLSLVEEDDLDENEDLSNVELK
jgi:hypothetical protein